MWIPQCAQCFLHFWRYNNIPWKPVCHWNFDILMWLLPSWCDFLPTRCYMGLMWLLPNWCDLNPSLVLCIANKLNSFHVDLQCGRLWSIVFQRFGGMTSTSSSTLRILHIPTLLTMVFRGGGPLYVTYIFWGGWGGRKCNLQPPKISKIPGFGTTLDDIGRRANRSNMLSANGRSGNIQLERGTFDWCS